MQITKNIKLILHESYRWRNRELIEPIGFVEPKLNLKSLIYSNLLLFITSLVLSLLLFKYINDSFAGYVIGALSIFVGLFTSVLILVFDKYLEQKKAFEINRTPSANSVLAQKKLANFSRQFVFISLESLLIALSLIAFLTIPLLLKEEYLKNVIDFHFVRYEEIKINQIILFFVNFFSLVSRTFIIMLLYKFLRYLFHIFGSLGAFLLGVFKNNIKI